MQLVKVAKKAEADKGREVLYDMLLSHDFTPVMHRGGFGCLRSHDYVIHQGGGKETWFQSTERKTSSYLLQRLSMAVQKGNVISILEEMMTILHPSTCFNYTVSYR